MRALIKLFGILVFSFLLSVLVDGENLGYIVEKIIFPASSIMVGLTIAVIGIFMGNINSLYLSLLDIFNKSKSLEESEKLAMLERLNRIKQELKENMLFVLIAFLTIIVLFFLKEIDIPGFSWAETVPYEFLYKNFLANVFIVALNFSIILAVYDSINGAFKLSEAFNLTKKS